MIQRVSVENLFLSYVIPDKWLNTMLALYQTKVSCSMSMIPMSLYQTDRSLNQVLSSEMNST